MFVRTARELPFGVSDDYAPLRYAGQFVRFEEVNSGGADVNPLDGRELVNHQRQLQAGVGAAGRHE